MISLDVVVITLFMVFSIMVFMLNPEDHMKTPLIMFMSLVLYHRVPATSTYMNQIFFNTSDTVTDIFYLKLIAPPNRWSTYITFQEDGEY